MKLEDKIAKYETVNWHHCSKCGNPWWFAMVDRLECTTCGHQYGLLNCSKQGDALAEEKGYN